MIRTVVCWRIANIFILQIIWYLTSLRTWEIDIICMLKMRKLGCSSESFCLTPKSALSTPCSHPHYCQPCHLSALQNLLHVTPSDQKHNSLLTGPPISLEYYIFISFKSTWASGCINNSQLTSHWQEHSRLNFLAPHTFLRPQPSFLDGLTQISLCILGRSTQDLILSSNRPKDFPDWGSTMSSNWKWATWNVLPLTTKGSSWPRNTWTLGLDTDSRAVKDDQSRIRYLPLPFTFICISQAPRGAGH